MNARYHVASHLLLFAVVSPLSADDGWPQWRGPTRDARSAGDPWPNALSADRLQQSWRVELGPSYSGPIVTSDRVFVTETKDRKTEVVRALHRQTGKELWRAEWAGALSVPFFAKANGDWIRSTPAFDGERLYVAGIRDLLICLDAKSGKELWKVDFVQQFGTPLPAFGCVCSPLIDDKFVYVQAGASVAKLDKLTGKVLWQALKDGGGTYGSAFSSPVIAALHGVRQLVVQSRTKLAGVHLEDGKVLWSASIPAFRGMNILTPTVIENRIFTSSYGGGAFLFEVEKSGTEFSLKEMWKNKVQGYMSSPVVIDHHVYLHLRNQRFACIDLKTGKEAWITTPFGKYWSMVVRNGRILALDERGDLLLINATPEKFDLLDKRHVSDRPTWAHLAVVGDELFIRELNAQTVYMWKGKKQTAARK
jgi:outer membrane protein assembly factor BamB